MSVFNGLVNLAELVSQVLFRLLWLVVIVSGLLLLLLFALLLLLFLFAAALLLYRLLKREVNRDLIKLLEVPRHRDFNDAGVVLQVEQELIQVHIHRCRARIEQNEILLDLADAADGRLQDALDEDAFLRVHHLIVALLKLTVDVNILHIETGEVLEHFIRCPGLYKFHSGFVFLRGEILHFDLYLGGGVVNTTFINKKVNRS